MNDIESSGLGREVGNYMGIAMRETEELHIVGIAPVGSHLLGPAGGVRTGALLTMIDNVGGLNCGLAALPEGWVVSTNMAARIVEPAHVGPLRFASHVLRRGRNNVVASVEIRDEGAHDTLVGSGLLTSAILIPEGGPPQWSRPLVLDTTANSDTGKPLPSITDWIGVHPVGPDTVEIDLAAEHRNPWGILHGGVVATLVDLAAEHATGGGFTTDVVLHYLAPNRVGPVRATARVLGHRSDGTVLRVEVTDVGAHRVTAVAIVTCTRP